jgi:hypothetical protein
LTNKFDRKAEKGLTVLKRRHMKIQKILLVFFGLGLIFSHYAYSQEGYLHVTSSPEKAEVNINNEKKGETPYFGVLKPGKYEVILEKKGYNTEAKTVEIIQGEVGKLHFTLQKPSLARKLFSIRKGKGNLTVITDTSDVSIYLDGKKETVSSPATIKDIPAGLHNLILVSGEYAMSDEILIRTDKTRVVKKSFEQFKAKRLAELKEQEEKVLKKESPPKVSMLFQKPQAEETEEKDIVMWGESDQVIIDFQYRKTGEEKWLSQQLEWGKKEDAIFETEAGNYEIKITASSYKIPEGVVNIFLGSKKKKVGETTTLFQKEFKPDIHYTYTLNYDGKTDLKYQLEEKPLEE